MKKKRQRKRVGGAVDEVPLTPMIDVVFQLLVYFVLTFEPMDVFTHLSVYRPAPDKEASKDTPPPEVIKIAIFPQSGYTMNDKMVTKETLKQLLFSLAELNPKQMIMIMCTAHSEHNDLVYLLDMCTEAKLTNLSVISTN